MGSWNDLLEEFLSQPEGQPRGDWLNDQLNESLGAIGDLRGDTNVLLYGTAFLQKPQAASNLVQLTGEELNGLMAVIYGMDFSKPLTLLLHTPGGVTNAAETVVAYLREKFADIEAIIPTYAMSAGTMVALATNRLVMGRQSQLGPIDPQMPIPATGRFISARAIVDQFDVAKKDIKKDPDAARAWAPVLPSLGHGLLQEARNALDYGEQMVAQWLEEYMFAGQTDAKAKAARAAKHFNDAAKHKSHGRRIGRDEARSVDIEVEDLEDNQELQEAVLTAYHLMTIVFEQGPASKMLITNSGRSWVKNVPHAPGEVTGQKQGQAPGGTPSGGTRQQRRQAARQAAKGQR